MKRILLVLASLLVPAMLHAQLPDPSTRALGMGEAYTSLARGYEAVAWNPAMLAAEGRPGFTIGLPHVSLELGSNTYGFSDFQKYANHYLTDADKQTLLSKIAPSDSTLTIRSLVGVAPFGLSIGPFGLAVGATGEMDLGVGRDAVELALYGNAKRTGPGQFFTARGSNGRGWAATTVAASLALPFRTPVGGLSVGVTGKYVLGNFVGVGSDLGTRIGANPLFQATVAGQTIYTEYAKHCGSFSLGGSGSCSAKAGSGVMADLGATLQFPNEGVTVSAVLVNAFGKMTWDDSRFTYERLTRHTTLLPSGQVQEDTVVTRLHGRAAIAADSLGRPLMDSLLAHANFARLARVGFAMRSGKFTLAADMQFRLAEGLDQQSSQVVSGGMEYRLLGFLPLRAGASCYFGEATMLSAGTGLQLAGINIDASIANISGTVHPGVRLGFGVGLIW